MAPLPLSTAVDNDAILPGGQSRRIADRRTHACNAEDAILNVAVLLKTIYKYVLFYNTIFLYLNIKSKINNLYKI